MQSVRDRSSSIEEWLHTDKFHIEPDCLLAVARDVDILVAESSTG